MMKEAIESLVESPAWALMDDRRKKMVEEITRVATDPDVHLDGRMCRVWGRWLEATLAVTDAADEVGLFPLNAVVDYGYRTVKAAIDPDFKRIASLPTPALIELKRDELRRLRAQS